MGELEKLTSENYYLFSHHHDLTIITLQMAAYAKMNTVKPQ